MPKNLSKLIKDHAAAAMGRNSNHGGGGGRCRKHPKHKQSPGVCSVCLREKLSNLGIATTKTKPIKIASFSSSSSSSFSSLSSNSSNSSPYFQRNPSISSMFKRRSTNNFLFTSSRSIADHDGIGKKKSNHGFWSKLMMNRRGKEIVEETLRRSTSTTDIEYH